MRKIKKALPIALVIMALFSLLALGVSAADCNHPEFTYEDTPYDCTSNYRVYTCTTCGYSYDDQIIGENNHQYEGEQVESPTCTTSGTMEYTCQNCGDSYTETIPASHGNEVPKSKGAEGHVYGCEYCDALDSEIQSHMFTTSPNVCATCGYVKSECDHSFVYKSNSAETHILTCSKCEVTNGDEIGHVWSNRTQMEQGNDEYHYIFKYTCSVCNATKTQEESIGCTDSHEWQYWNVDGTYHIQNCMKCATSGEKSPHVFGDGVVLQSPSLNVEGITRYTCILCNYYKEEVAPALNINDVLNRCTNKEAVQLFDALYNKFKPAINSESSTVVILEMSGLSEFVNKIFPDIEENHYASQYWAEYGDVYQILYDGLIDNDLAYELGYNDAISAVVDKNPIQGLFQGMFAGMAMFYQTVTAGISLGGISLNNAVTTIFLIVLAFLLLKVLFKRG